MTAPNPIDFSTPDIEAQVRARLEPLIVAEVASLVEIGEAARRAAIHAALDALSRRLDGQGSEIERLGAQAIDRALADQSGAKPHPVAAYWAKFTPEERSAMLRERRRKGLQKRKGEERAAAAVLPFRRERSASPFRVVDLFCGAGGTTQGWIDAGFSVVLGVDNSEAALTTYRANHSHPAINLDLKEVGRASEIVASYHPDIIVGSPPCTDFSPAGPRREGHAAELTRRFAEIVAQVRPRIVVMENVPQVCRSPAYADACAVLRQAGYGLSMVVLDASRCGVPQRRKRLFLVGMAGAQEGWVDLTEGLATTPLSLKAAFGPTFPRHHYRHPCNSQGRAIFSADQPSPTIRGTNRPMSPSYIERSGDSASPEVARALTTQERAAVQTFPADYRWCGTKTEIELQIGNAVPPNLASYVAGHVSRWLHLCNLANGHALAA